MSGTSASATGLFSRSRFRAGSSCASEPSGSTPNRAGTISPTSVDEPAWLGIGYIVADLGGLILLVSLITGGIGVRRLRAGGGAGLLKATLILALVLLAAYVVAVWAMAGKPD